MHPAHDEQCGYPPRGETMSNHQSIVLVYLFAREAGMHSSHRSEAGALGRGTVVKPGAWAADSDQTDQCIRGSPR